MGIEEQYNYISETINGTDGDDYFSLYEEGSGTNVINGYAGDDVIGFLGLAPTYADGGPGADIFDFSSIPPTDNIIEKTTLIGNFEEKDTIQFYMTGEPSNFDGNASVLGASEPYELGVINLSDEDFSGSVVAADVDGNTTWDYYVGIDTDDADINTDNLGADDLDVVSDSSSVANYVANVTLSTDGGTTDTDDTDDTDVTDDTNDGTEDGPGSEDTNSVNNLGDGNNTFTGDSTSEEVYGQAGNDTIFAGTGADSIYGNQGNDLINGEDGDDALFGGQNGGEPTPDKNGTLKQQQGTETIVGGSGSDLIYGNFGTDDIEGDGDNDELFGGQGNDLIDGGPGDDTIWGNVGTDTLVGGDGADDFLVFSGGQDRITDFDPAEGDTVGTLSDFDQTNAVSHPDGMALEWQRGTSEGTVVIEGQSPESFSSDWIG